MHVQCTNTSNDVHKPMQKLQPTIENPIGSSVQTRKIHTHWILCYIHFTDYTTNKKKSIALSELIAGHIKNTMKFCVRTTLFRINLLEEEKKKKIISFISYLNSHLFEAIRNASAVVGAADNEPKHFRIISFCV